MAELFSLTPNMKSCTPVLLIVTPFLNIFYILHSGTPCLAEKDFRTPIFKILVRTLAKYMIYIAVTCTCMTPFSGPLALKYSSAQSC